MAGDNGLGNLRFAGYGYPALADQLDRLREGPGSESLHLAATALQRIAEELANTDRTLRQQLAAIGVYWEGEASEGGQEATKQAGVYAADAAPTVTDSSNSATAQGEIYSGTSGSAPQGSELRGATQKTVWDQGMGFLGHTTDHAAEVERTREAHQRAVAAMNDYARNSGSLVTGVQSLPVPPKLNLSQGVAGGSGMTSPQGVTSSQAAYTPGGAPGGFNGSAPVTTGPGGQAGPFTGLNPGTPGFNPGAPGEGFPPGGNPGNPGNPLSPGSGRVSGVGPIVPGINGMPSSGPFGPGLRPGFPGPLMGEIATAAGIAGAGGAGAAAGATAEKDQVVRGGKGSPGGADAAKRALSAAALPEEEARAARNAERLGGRSGRPSSSLMQPATGSGSRGEDDDEHVRKYGVDSDDVFGDDRLVIPSVLGEDD
ncbi:PPE domain-containing protein [Actinokineospora auranticolor]|uniref:PPE family protein n=1 Tax=Actinokineospora auranticolor TaxID=155976 RepID=A0A2S6GRR5_9PSEU|nr:PPE domain-containing protein [Actinokineospora auranticolor]PPK67886.1 PPE family protein [Actinokineospora auranticolor]